MPVIMKVEDLQRAAGICKITAYELVKSDGFPKINVGKRILIPKEAFIKWINSKIEAREIINEEV